MQSIQKFFKSQDDFGYQVRLNFNQEGSVYQTPLGGCMTLVFKILSLSYLVKCLIVMFTLGDSKINQFSVPAEPEDLAETSNSKM